MIVHKRSQSQDGAKLHKNKLRKNLGTDYPGPIRPRKVVAGYHTPGLVIVSCKLTVDAIQEDLEEQQETDIYDEEGREELLEEDEISAMEAAFMQGYDDA